MYPELVRYQVQCESLTPPRVSDHGFTKCGVIMRFTGFE